MLETISISHLPFIIWYWEDIESYGVSEHIRAFAKKAGVVGCGCAKDPGGHNTQIFVFNDGNVQIRAITSANHPWEKSKRLKVTPTLTQLLHRHLTYKPGDWLLTYHAALGTQPYSGYKSYQFPEPKKAFVMTPALAHVTKAAEAAILHLLD